ncbi:MAG TPA: SdpI family protein [Phycisphaerae bacterium]|nr:SdpI family protein [Phycisphaerae bacterium]
MIPRNHLISIGILFVAACGVSLYFQDRLPDPCPIHWNLHGEIDDYGPPLLAAWLMPMVTVGITALLAALPLLGPFRKNIEGFRVVYGRICVMLAGIFLALHVLFMLEAVGWHTRIGPSIGVICGIMFVALGNWMGKMRRNLYIGIRTPWTLANDVVWEKTHRLGGRLFVASGLLSIVVCLFAPDWMCFAVLIGTVGITTVWVLLYSLVCYRKLGQVDDLHRAPDGASS